MPRASDHWIFFEFCLVTILPSSVNNKKNENFPFCAENVGEINSDFFSYTNNWQKVAHKNNW